MARLEPWRRSGYGSAMLIAAIGWSQTAFAEPVILTAGPPEAAITALNERRPASGAEVRTVPLSELRGRPAFVDGTGRVWGCNTVAEGTIATHVATAQRAIGYTRLLEADDALDDALGLAVCQHALDVAGLWGVWYLKGIVATYLEDPTRARQAFRVARTLDPERGWDEQYADGRSWFDEAATPLPADLRVTVLPDPGGAVRVDGREPTWSGSQILLSAGTHFIELGRVAPITLQVELAGRGSTTLIVPSLLPDDMLAWPARPDRWRDLDLVMRGLLPDSQGPWGFYRPPELWWGPTAGGPFENLPPPPAATVRAPVPAWVWLGGTVGLAAGATAGGCVLGGRQAGRAVIAATDQPYDQFADALDDYRAWNTCVITADVIGVAGLGTASVGLIRHLTRRSR